MSLGCGSGCGEVLTPLGVRPRGYTLSEGEKEGATSPLVQVTVSHGDSGRALRHGLNPHTTLNNTPC